MDQTSLQTTRTYGVPPTALRNRGALSDQERVLSAGVGTILAILGMRWGRLTGLLTSLTGGALIARAATGYCPVSARLKSSPLEKQVAESFNWRTAATVSRSVTIRKPVEEIYRAWRNLEGLPRFMQDVESVRDLGNGRSHWVAKAPFGRHVQWDCEITQDDPTSASHGSRSAVRTTTPPAPSPSSPRPAIAARK
jgi:uncharacterized membrane protein